MSRSKVEVSTPVSKTKILQNEIDKSSSSTVKSNKKYIEIQNANLKNDPIPLKSNKKRLKLH
jgi:hypothetical protein